MPKGKPITEEFRADVALAVAAAGSQTNLAKALGKSPSCVSGWLNGSATSVTGKSTRQVAEYLSPPEAIETVSVPINVNSFDPEDHVPQTGEEFPQPEYEFSDNEEVNFAQEVLNALAKVRVRQKGCILGWQLDLKRKAEKLLGLRDERNEPVEQYRPWA